jgi:hypothetical protein
MLPDERVGHMQEEFVEFGLVVAEFLLYGMMTTLLAGTGVVLEYQSYVTSGDQIVATWLGVMGLVLLTFAYLLARDRLGGAYGDLRAQL